MKSLEAPSAAVVNRPFGSERRRYSASSIPRDSSTLDELSHAQHPSARHLERWRIFAACQIAREKRRTTPSAKRCSYRP